MSFEKIKKIAANNQYEFVYKKKCKSTMLDLKELYNIKNKNYIILSEEQTNGIGEEEISGTVQKEIFTFLLIFICKQI